MCNKCSFKILVARVKYLLNLTLVLLKFVYTRAFGVAFMPFVGNSTFFFFFCNGLNLFTIHMVIYPLLNGNIYFGTNRVGVK